MDQIQHKKGKMFYTMGEVTEMFDVNASLIRFWEQKFDILKPKKNKKGNRLFTPEDVDNLKLIYHLVKEKGMTLEGARRRIKDNREGAQRDMEVVDRLLSIKAMLLEIRQQLKESGIDMDAADDEDGEDTAALVSRMADGGDCVEPQADTETETAPETADENIETIELLGGKLDDVDCLPESEPEIPVPEKFSVDTENEETLAMFSDELDRLECPMPDEEPEDFHDQVYDDYEEPLDMPEEPQEPVDLFVEDVSSEPAPDELRPWATEQTLF